MMPVSGAVAALGAVSVKTAADFDSAMSKVAAVSGATGEDFDKLRDKAREMGSKTKFSASDLLYIAEMITAVQFVPVNLGRLVFLFADGFLHPLFKLTALQHTDRAAMECIDPHRRGQDMDNWIWIRDAEKNRLMVGTQARILYQDAVGRMTVALKFNEMVRKGEIGPVMLG